MLNPIDVSGFQKQLDAICRDHATALRIVWGPSRVRSRLLLNGESRTFMVYPDVTRQDGLKGFERWTRGDRLVRNGVAVGYRTAAGILTGSPPQPGDVYEPDFEYVQYAHELFIIEQKLEDNFARRMHARYRDMCVRSVGIDGMGEFPAEGWWQFYDEISEHRDGCCERAAERQTRCWGLSREPNQADLTRIRFALWVRDQEPVLRNREDPPTQREIDQHWRDRQAEIEEWEAKRLAEMKAELADKITERLKPLMTPSEAYNSPNMEGLFNDDSTRAAIGS
jgi:hypothetical protein